MANASLNAAKKAKKDMNITEYNAWIGGIARRLQADPDQGGDGGERRDAEILLVSWRGHRPSRKGSTVGIEVHASRQRRFEGLDAGGEVLLAY